MSVLFVTIALIIYPVHSECENVTPYLFFFTSSHEISLWHGSEMANMAKMPRYRLHLFTQHQYVFSKYTIQNKQYHILNLFIKRTTNDAD